MEEKEYQVEEYSLLEVKGIIANYRREFKYKGNIRITFPYEVETSILSLQEMYKIPDANLVPPGVLFTIGDIEYGKLIVAQLVI